MTDSLLDIISRLSSESQKRGEPARIELYMVISGTTKRINEQVRGRIQNYLEKGLNIKPFKKKLEIYDKNPIHTNFPFDKEYGLDFYTGKPTKNTITGLVFSMEGLDVEFLEKKIIVIPRAYNRLLKELLKLVTIIQESDNVYKYSVRDELIKEFNKRVGNGEGVEFLVVPKYLKFSDITWGTLLGNGVTNYMVEYKPEGPRKFLMFTEDAMYLLSPPYNCNILAVATDPDTRAFFNSNRNLILDGNLIPQDKQTIREGSKIRNMFIATDVVFSPIECTEYADRYNLMKKLAADFHTLVHKKNIWKLSEPNWKFLVISSHLLQDRKVSSWPPTEHFFKLLELMLKEGETSFTGFNLGLASQPFLVDGLIFKPDKLERSTGTVYKWKFPNKLSVALENRDGKLYTMADKTVKVDIPNNITMNYSGIKLKSGKILEFELKDGTLKAIKISETMSPMGLVNKVLEIGSGEISLLYDSGKLYAKTRDLKEYKVPVDWGEIPPVEGILEFKFVDDKLIPKIPLNRKYPDDLELVREVRELTTNPISIATLTGGDFKLVSEYFKKLISEFSAGLEPGSKLLSLGNVENVETWKGLDVTILENNKKRLKRLEEKFEKYPNIIPVDEEDIAEKYDAMIVNAGFDTGKIAELADKVLDKAGTLFILFLDGASLMEELKPLYRPGLTIPKINFGPVVISLETDNTVVTKTLGENISIPESREKLFKLFDLLSILPNFKISEIGRAGGELLLTREQYKYCQLFSWVKLEKIKIPKGIKMQIVKAIPSKVGKEISYKGKKKNESPTTFPEGVKKLDLEPYGELFLIEAKNLADAVLQAFSETYIKYDNDPEITTGFLKAIFAKTKLSEGEKLNIENNILGNKYNSETFRIALSTISKYIEVTLVVLEVRDGTLKITNIAGNYNNIIVIFNNQGIFYTVGVLEKSYIKTVFSIKGKGDFEKILDKEMRNY